MEKDQFQFFVDLARKSKMFKDPAQFYIGKVARHNQKMTNQFFKAKNIVVQFRGACRRVVEVPREGANQEKHVGKKTDGRPASQNRTSPAFLEYRH